VLTHVVSFTFAVTADRDEARARLQALLPQIPPLLTLETGIDVVRDPGAADLVLITTHEDLAGLRAYQEHPAHEAFGAWVRPRLSAKTVVDFEG
jgi:hypothetical protein